MANIPGGSGLDVFVNQVGTITIRQEDESTEGEPMLFVHPDDVSTLMKALDRARCEAQRAAADEHEEVTVPELPSHWRTGSA
jgi:hypothetical protein